MSTTSQPSSDVEQIPDTKGAQLAHVIATFGYIGYFPRAPGTAASIATVLLWWPFIWLGTPYWARLLVSVAICLIGVWASERARRFWKDREDPQTIVIDEVAGQSLALSLCWLNPWSILAGLALFRFFDILKPGPIGWLDRNVKGGLGIMLDDIAAGVAAGILIWVAQMLVAG
jgi:phosphatidylglycerophosphatase A